MSGAMNRHCISRIMSTAWQGTSLRECQGIIKTMAQGLAPRIACLAPVPQPEETGRYDLAWKDLCSVLNALSK